jgi:hypothetical protein
MTDNISLCPAECVQEEEQEVRAIGFATGLSSFGSSLLRSLAALRRFNPISRGAL